MASPPAGPRPQAERTFTWPPRIHIVIDEPASHEPELGSASASTENKPSHDSFGDFDDHPENHFLSPMQYDDWASDSDDDGEEIEWDAGITDFALFDSDRRRAVENGEPPGARWDDFLASQRSVLDRTMERSRSEPAVDTTKPPLPVEDVPSLTPDSSPHLRDDLEVESNEGQRAPSVAVPNYLTVTITPPTSEDRTIEDDEDLPLSFSLHRAKPRKRAPYKVPRPGLRHTRTLSGKAHVWRRPSWHIYPVGEEPEAEERAERGMIRRVEGQEDLRGRRSSRNG